VIDNVASTVLILEAVQSSMNKMNADELDAFHLDTKLGGTSAVLQRKSIERCLHLCLSEFGKFAAYDCTLYCRMVFLGHCWNLYLSFVSCIFCNGENLLEVTNAGILRMDVISVILQAAILKWLMYFYTLNIFCRITYKQKRLYRYFVALQFFVLFFENYVFCCFNCL